MGRLTHSFENFNLAYNFWTVSARALIFHMRSRIACDKTFLWVPLFLCPPWKGGILFCNCRSVNQVLSAQYLLTPSLDQYQTWCRVCLLRVDDFYWFSGHMFKVQGQTTLLSSLYCLLNIFWPLQLINTKLVAGVALNE